MKDQTVIEYRIEAHKNALEMLEVKELKYIFWNEDAMREHRDAWLKHTISLDILKWFLDIDNEYKFWKL